MTGFLSGIGQLSDAVKAAATPTPGASDVSGSLGAPQGAPTASTGSDPMSSFVQMAAVNPSPSTVQADVASRLAGAGLTGVDPNSFGRNTGGAAAPTAAAIAGSAPTGNLASWIAQAEQATGVGGPDWTNGLNLIAEHESGGNPTAVNNWDSNAAAGHPSQGLMQTIPSTFDAYVPSGMKSLGIDNPVANLAAAIGYINSRYHGIQNVPGVVAVAAGRPYVGY